MNGEVQFDARLSQDNIKIVSYAWDFGDETSATGSSTTHSYFTPGTYLATLSVTDEAGYTASDTIIITVTAIPATLDLWLPILCSVGFGVLLSLIVYFTKYRTPSR